MIRVLIGHRGTGKTSLLKRLQEYFGAENEYYDLDHEIEISTERQVSEIFEQSGENFFRELEVDIFRSILKKCHSNSYIVLGAGFNLMALRSVNNPIEVWWVRRDTDLEGRIFVDRPRLDLSKDPLTEFLQRAKMRENQYAAIADRTYVLPEGEIQAGTVSANVEKSLFAQSWRGSFFTITLLPDFKEVQLAEYMRALVQVELRDDLLDDSIILDILDKYPKGNFLFSFRKSRSNFTDFWKSDFFVKILAQVHFLDWAWELGEPVEFYKHVIKSNRILSLHGDMNSSFQDYATKANLIKWAPLVETWKELEDAYVWKQGYDNRVFLPRSHNGRWKWFRQYSYYQQELLFVREGSGSALDQPTLSDALSLPGQKEYFAAILGDPVRHSYSPLEHREDFYNRKAPFWSIQINKNEFIAAFKFLKRLGLKAAAVTSPLKELAAKTCEYTNTTAVNTLWIEDGVVEGISTDDIGFAALIADLKLKLKAEDAIAVWGGGGTLEVLKKSLPRAQFYSSSQGLPREGSQAVDHIKALIWAAPRLEGTMMPSKSWQPDWIYDLNYKEDSIGREYAQISGAKYISGLAMFKAQAQAQRLYWQKKTGELK